MLTLVARARAVFCCLTSFAVLVPVSVSAQRAETEGSPWVEEQQIEPSDPAPPVDSAPPAQQQYPVQQQYPAQQAPPQYPPQQYPPQQYPPQQYPPQQYPPQQYPPQQYPPQQYPPQPHYTPPPGYPPPPQREQPAERPRVDVTPEDSRESEPNDIDDPNVLRLNKITNFRFGWNVVGRGTMQFRGECSGTCPVPLTNGKADTADLTRLLFGLDLQWGGDPLVVGFGFWFMPHVTLEQDQIVTSGTADKDLGFEFTMPFILGGLVPVSEQMAVSVRGFVGPQFLFGGGEGAIERDADAYDSLCDDLRTQGVDDCGSGAETRLGLTPGVGGGAVFRVSPRVSMSAELLMQYTNLELFSFEAESASWSARQTYSYEGLRLWLVLGVGVGK